MSNLVEASIDRSIIKLAVGRSSNNYIIIIKVKLLVFRIFFSQLIN